jgi:hypothetical protein
MKIDNMRLAVRASSENLSAAPGAMIAQQNKASSVSVMFNSMGLVLGWLCFVCLVNKQTECV